MGKPRPHDIRPHDIRPHDIRQRLKIGGPHGIARFLNSSTFPNDSHRFREF